MRKWAFFVAAAVAVIGCGGNSSDNGTSTGTGTGTTAGSTLTVNMNENFGTVGFTFLTGQGRAEGDLTAVVRRLEIQDEVGLVRTDLEAPHRLPLAEYVLDVLRLNVPFTGQSGRLFESFPLAFTGFLVENPDNGSGVPTFSDLTPPATEDIPARIRVVPGRDVSLPIYLDDSMFSQSGSDVVFDRAQFNLRNNLEATGSYISSFFSDYVSFDLTGMADAARPLLSNGERADMLLVSGDNYAIAAGGRFEVLTLDEAEPIVGTYGDEGLIGSSYRPGTYTLKQPNPTDILGLLQITALAGQWRSAIPPIAGRPAAFSNFGQFEFILFPTSRFAPADGSNGNGLRPDEDQEVVIVQRNGTGVITSLYFGYADLDTGAFTAYPISQIVTAGVEGEISGTLNGYVNANGSATAAFELVRRGRYNISSAGTSGFPTTGTFVVFRK